MVFYGDLYGISGPPPYKSGAVKGLVELALVRKLYAHGSQTNYWDQRNCIGWVRRGAHGNEFGCAVIMSNAREAEKRMSVGRKHAKEIWTDVVRFPIANGGTRLMNLAWEFWWKSGHWI